MNKLASCILSSAMVLGAFAAANAQTPAPPPAAAPELPRPVAPPIVTAPPVPPVPQPGTLGDGPPMPARPFSITKNDPGLDAVISPNAKLVLLNDKFGLTEGPSWARDGKGGGYFVFVDMLANVIYKMDTNKKDNEVSVYLDHAGYSGTDINHAGIQSRRGRVVVILVGAQCTSRDSVGRLLWCASNDGAIMRLEKDGTRTILANNYQGMRFNGPNDMSVKADGSIYFTDADTGLRDGRLSPQKQMPYTGVFLVQPDKVTLLLDNKQLGGGPNGIALSPDGKYLYLTGGRATMMRYPVKDDDTLGDGTVFAQGLGIGDGMKTDLEGDVLSTGGAGPGEVRITAPDGRFLGLLNIPLWAGEPKREICALNDAFGDKDAKTLLITGCEAVFKIRLKTPGIIPGPAAY